MKADKSTPMMSGAGNYSTGLYKPSYAAVAVEKINHSSVTSSKNEATVIYTFFKTLSLIALFMMVGPALILLNKFIMQDLHFPYPLCLSGFGILSSAIFARILVYFNFASIEKREEVEGAMYFKRVLPVGIAYAGTLASGNMVYLLLDVGLIQMLKSFTPVVVMAFLFLSGIEYPDRPVIISILIISFGTALTCSYTPNASMLGMAVMLLSEIFEAVRLVLTQFLLKDMKLGVIEGQYVLSPATAVFLFLSSAVFEVPNMIKTGQYMSLFTSPWHFAISAILGIIVNFLSYFVIQLTSSLSLKILVMFRNFFVIIIGILLYKEETSTSEIVGYFFALIGFAGYNAAKMGLWIWTPTEHFSFLPVMKPVTVCADLDTVLPKTEDGESKELRSTTSTIAAILKKKIVRHSQFATRALQSCSKDSLDGAERTALLDDSDVQVPHVHNVGTYVGTGAMSSRQKQYSMV